MHMFNENAKYYFRMLISWVRWVIDDCQSNSIVANAYKSIRIEQKQTAKISFNLFDSWLLLKNYLLFCVLKLNEVFQAKTLRTPSSLKSDVWQHFGLKKSGVRRAGQKQRHARCINKR